MKPWENEFFASGATPYGTHPNRYLRVRPFGISTIFTGLGVPSTGPFSGWDGLLTDGHGGASFHVGPGTTLDDISGHSVERTIFQADGSVEASPVFQVEAGVPNEDSFRSVFLWARTSGGSVAVTGSNLGSTEFHDGVEGIFFAQLKLGLSPSRFVLGYVQGGAVTLLGNVLVSDFITGNAAQEQAIGKMRLEVNGFNVRGYRTFTNNATVGEGSSTSETRIFSITSSSFPQASGRWGIGAQVFRDQPNGCRCGVRFNNIAIRGAEGDLLYRDNFERALPGASDSSSVDPTGVAGNSLMQAWTGDGAGETVVFPSVGHLTSAGDEVGLGPDISISFPSLSQNYGWMIWQNRAPSPQQHRSALLTFDGDAAVAREAGIWLRGSFDPVAPFQVPDLRSESEPGGIGELDYRKRGYLALVEWDGASGWSLRVDAYDFSTLLTYSPVTIATASLGTSGLAIGTPFRLALEVRNFAGADVGFPALRVKINGQVVTPNAQALGVAVQDSWVIDNRSAAVNTGATTGLFFQPSAYSPDLLLVGDWRQEDLSGPPDTQQEEDQVSIPQASETEGLFGTLDIPLSWGIEEVTQSFSRSHEYETGHIQKSPRMHRHRRLWRVEMRGATARERESARAFWREHRSVETPFNWALPVTGELVPVRFLSTSFTWRRSANGANAVGVEIYGILEIEELFHASLIGSQANAS